MRRARLWGCFLAVLLAASLCSAEPRQDIESIAKGSNAFATDLYSRLAHEPGNLFFSPYSISSALAMTYAGARGQTAAQMAQVLHFSVPDDRLHAAFGAVADDLNSGGKVDGKAVYELSVANALWGQSGFAFNPAYIRLLHNDYQAELHQADFDSGAKEASADINQWVEQKTNGKIKNLVSPAALNNAHEVARLVLVNAIYFKGKWETEFKKEDTQSQPFHLEGQKDVQAPLMHQEIECAAMENDDFQAIELPYTGGSLSMVILLPRRADGLPALEGKLTAENLNQWLGQLREYQVQAYVPAFKMESQFELSNELISMGMNEAFSGEADFSGMTPATSLQIGWVIHKAFVDVNEEGTEAAGATAVVVVHPVVVIRQVSPPPMTFRADHPFVFLIRQKTSGAILFMGRVENPST
ncbi:MAG: serpin family protein [Tepidisphaeraceae bacterium]|jgi:serpin B